MEAVTRGQFTGDNKKAVKRENGSFVERVYARACENDKGGCRHGRTVNFYNLWEND